jgi:hypothetical protein
LKSGITIKTGKEDWPTAPQLMKTAMFEVNSSAWLGADYPQPPDLGLIIIPLQWEQLSWAANSSSDAAA